MLTLHPVDDVRVRHRELKTLHRAGIPVRLIGAVPRLLGGELKSELVEAVGDPMSGLRERALHHLRLLRRLVRDRPSIVHLHDPELLWLAPLGKAMRVQLVYDCHEYHELLYSRRVPRRMRPYFEWTYVSLERLIVRLFVDRVATVTPQLVGRFDGVRPVVNIENYAAKSISRSQAQPMDDWLESRNGVISIGSLGVNRGTHLMLDVFKEILETSPHIRLYMTARYSQRYTAEMLHSALKARGLDGHVTLLPNAGTETLSTYLGACRIGLSVTLPGPDADGAYPTKLFEYMAQQLAVVTTAARNSAEIVEDTNAGLVVPFNPVDAADAICKLHDEPMQAFEHGLSGYRAFQTSYCWETGPADRLISMYQQLATTE